jgi:hypothetical protein
MSAGDPKEAEMTKNLFALFLVAFLALAATAQQQIVEPGQPQELKGLTRIYVSASDSAARNNIIAEIKKRLPQLTITERSADAEVWLLFSAEKRNSPKTDPTMDIDSRTSGTSVTYEIIGSGAVIKPG